MRCRSGNSSSRLLASRRPPTPHRRPSSRPATGCRNCHSPTGNSRLPGADSRAAALPRAARDRDTPHACARRVWRHARQALRGHRPLWPHRDELRLPGEINGRHVFDPSPIPKFDNAKLHRSAALQLFGAGREQRIYAVPPYTSVVSLDFEDHPFSVQGWEHACAQCGSTTSYLDEVVVDDAGSRLFVCSDTDHCAGSGRRSPGQRRSGEDDAPVSVAAREAAECDRNFR